jgi:hypothetical protein
MTKQINYILKDSGYYFATIDYQILISLKKIIKRINKICNDNVKDIRNILNLPELYILLEKSEQSLIYTYTQHSKTTELQTEFFLNKIKNDYIDEVTKIVFSNNEFLYQAIIASSSIFDILKNVEICQNKKLNKKKLIIYLNTINMNIIRITELISTYNKNINTEINNLNDKFLKILK